MATAPLSARQATLTLLASSVPLQPDLKEIRSALMAPALDWDDVLYCADGHGITPLLHSCWAKCKLDAFVPETARERMARAYADNATRNADARREFGEVMELMSRSQVETLVLKGLPLLGQLYSDPAQRVLYDFDLLARNVAQAQRGFDALQAAGFTPVPTKAGAAVNKHLPSLWRMDGFVRRGYLFDVAQPRPVELHLRLWDQDWRGLDVREIGDLWARSEITQLDGLRVRVLAAEHVLIHLCVHLATHWIEREARLGQAIDVARLLQQKGAALDWERIVATGHQAQVSRFVYLGLSAAARLTGARLPPPPILTALREQTPRRLRVWAEEQCAADLVAMDYRKPDLQHAYALTFAATQSWREKMGVLRFALLPPLDTLEQEYGERSRALYARHIGGRGRVYLNSLFRSAKQFRAAKQAAARE